MLVKHFRTAFIRYCFYGGAWFDNLLTVLLVIVRTCIFIWFTTHINSMFLGKYRDPSLQMALSKGGKGANVELAEKRRFWMPMGNTPEPLVCSLSHLLYGVFQFLLIVPCHLYFAYGQKSSHMKCGWNEQCVLYTGFVWKNVMLLTVFKYFWIQLLMH